MLLLSFCPFPFLFKMCALVLIRLVSSLNILCFVVYLIKCLASKYIDLFIILLHTFYKNREQKNTNICWTFLHHTRSKFSRTTKFIQYINYLDKTRKALLIQFVVLVFISVSISLSLSISLCVWCFFCFCFGFWWWISIFLLFFSL